MELSKLRSLNLVTAFVLFICVSSLSGVSLLILGLFTPFFSFLAGFVIVLIFFLIFKLKLSLSPGKPTVYLVVVLLVSLSLRLPPSQYIMGGQDQGTYLNIGHQYLQQNSLKYQDNFRISLNGEQRILYDKYINYLMPSIELNSLKESLFEMKFYPLHSIWISIFESMLGKNGAVLSLTFFSIVSITTLFFLAYELSGKNIITAYIVGMLLATNPLHSFFSKFSVGEITATSYTFLALYFLVRYVTNIEKNENQTTDLVISLLSFTCFFFTRMSSILYIPVFILFSILISIYVENFEAKKKLVLYFIFLIISFCISYLYYYFFQPSLFYLIYRTTIQRIVPHHSDLALLTVLSVWSILIIVLSRIRHQVTHNRIRTVIERSLPTLLFFSIIALLYFAYKTFLRINLQAFLDSDTFVRYWYRGAGEIQKVKYLSLFVIIQYITPLGFILLLTAGFYYLRNIRKNIINISLFTTIIWFLIVSVKFGGLIKYPYYNARYLLTEPIIYIILMVGLFIGHMLRNKKRLFSFAALFLILICSLPFSLFQLHGPEGPHMNFYNNLNSILTKNDLILTATGHSTDKPQKYFDNFTTWSIAPLKFYYDLNLFILPDLSDAYTQPIKELANRYDKTYLISDKKLNGYGDNLITTKHRYSYYNVSEECSLHTYSFLPLESVKTMKIPKFLECLTPPNNYYTRYSDLYMYDITDKIKTEI